MTRYLIPPTPPEDLPPPPTAEDFNIPAEAFGARTAFGALEPGEQLDPGYWDEANRANSTRAAELQNQFLDRQREILHTGPDAYLNKAGRDAVLAAPGVLAQLEAARQAAIEQTATDAQRKMLSSALGEHRITEHYRVGTHAGEQSLEWQKQIATERLNQLRQQAALDYSDPASIEAYARASESAARERSRTKKLGKDSNESQAEIDGARSSIWRSAIEAALAKMHTAPAIALFRQAADRMSPADTAALAPQIDAAKEHQAGQAYLATVPMPDTRDLDELDAAHRSATTRNEADWPDNDSQRATNQYFIDGAFNLKRRDGLQAKADLDRSVQAWLSQPGQILRPPPDVWARLDLEERQAVDDLLLQNIHHPTPVGPPPATPEITPLYHSEEEAPRQPDDEPPKVELPPVDSGDTDPNPPPRTKDAGSMALPAAALPQSALPTVADVAANAGRVLGPLAVEVAPLVGTAAAATAAALPILIIPGNSQEQTIDLGDGLRARIAPGQRSISIERRTDKGIFGSDVGAKWEGLPIEANVDVDRNHRQVLSVNPHQLRKAIGNEAANRVLARPGGISGLRPLPAWIPQIIEMRIGESLDSGITTTHREATEEEVQKVCPSYGEFKRIAQEASNRNHAAGIPYGLKFGTSVHTAAKNEIKKIAKASDLLEKRGIFRLLPEVALRDGVIHSQHRVKGSAVLDVLEAYKRKKKLCIYDFKTGNATFPDNTKARYAWEAGRVAIEAFQMGYAHIYIVPVHVK